MQAKKEILELLESGSLTVDEALVLLKHADDSDKKDEKKDDTYDSAINTIYEEVLGDLNFDGLFNYMESKDWSYVDGKVTPDSVKETIKTVIKESVDQLIKKYIETNDEDSTGIIKTGGFVCNSYIDEGTVEVEVEFIPESGYSDYDLNNIIQLYKKQSV